MTRARSSKNNSTANLGFEAKLWLAADKLRSNMDAAECKHVVLGLIFLKYIADAFEEKHAALHANKKGGADPRAGADTHPLPRYNTLLPMVSARRKLGRLCLPTTGPRVL